MAQYEYKTVPVPRRPKKIRGIKGPGPQAAAVFGKLITEEAVDGWRYLGMEQVPIQQGGGLFSRPHIVEQGVLVFEREIAGRPVSDRRDGEAAPRHSTPPIAAKPATAEVSRPVAEPSVGMPPVGAPAMTSGGRHAAEPPVTSQVEPPRRDEPIESLIPDPVESLIPMDPPGMGGTRKG